ncbi:MAG TPA: DUF3606 domain-containing protein [Burkholderiales bacterium]|nr:DUF3606 domain-containing protein [Burkholderiales bacterium]
MERPTEVIEGLERTTINMSEGSDIRYWSSQFGISVAQLKAVVREAGNNAEDVRKALAASGARAWRNSY